MPSDNFASRELGMLISQNEEMRRTLRMFERPVDPIVEAIRMKPDPLGLSFMKDLRTTLDVTSEAQRLTDLVSGAGAARGIASELAGLVNTQRSVLDQLAGLGGLSQTANGSFAAAVMGLPKSDIFGLATRASFDFVERFRLPEMDEMSRLIRDITRPTERQYGLTAAALEASLGAMNQPWLKIQDTLSSVTGIAKLHGIGHLVATEPPFAATVAKALRRDFGDWRDPITWPSGLAEDASVRASLYVDQGFNPVLTEFPFATFEEGLDSSGLRDDVPVLVALYGDPVPRSEDDEEEGSFARNNQVHDWLQRFETSVREFIDVAMTATFGPEWPRHQLPNGLLDAWLDKKSKDTSGQNWPLISYADFTDYERIICKQDNWRAAFAPRFRRQELVRESFQRIYPTRLAAMHARPLMHEDELFVFVEIRRLVKLFRA